MDLLVEIKQEAEEADTLEEADCQLLPEKSRSRYENELRAFNEWRQKKAISTDLNETVMLEYVSSLSKKFKASSLWTKFSMLKKAFIVSDGVDISRFGKVMAFMKKQNINYVPKKSKVLSVEQCRKFILEASDDFLLCKVVLIFGLYGACRRDELVKLTVDDITDHEKYVLVKLQKTKPQTSRSFIIPDAQESLNAYDIYKKYAKLRPSHVGSRRFFLGYQHGRCVAQPAGMHTIGGVPRKVAEFLGLDQPGNYTGHCLRRSGASMVAESGGNLLPVKQIGGGTSSSSKEDTAVAEKAWEAPTGFVIKGAVPSVINIANMSSKQNYETLSVSVPKEFVYHVELNRPSQMNAMNKTMWLEIGKCFQELNSDENCRVIVLSGAGKIFCAGLDFKDMMNIAPELAEKEDLARKAKILHQQINKYQNSITSLELCKKPVLAAVHSACVGGAVDLITAADMRYCTKDAWFQVKEVDIGMAADVGTLQRLPKVLGSESLVRELCYTARKMPAAEALSSGLVSRVFEDKDSMVQGVVEIAEVISKKSPVAVQGTKVNLVYSRDHTVQEGLDHIALWNQFMLQSEDFTNAAVAQATKQSDVVFAKL